MSLFASVSLIFVLLTLEYAFAFIMFHIDEGKYLNLLMICHSVGHTRKKMSVQVQVKVEEIRKQKFLRSVKK